LTIDVFFFFFAYLALHWASTRAQKKVINLLLQKGADINLKDNGGVTPLHLATIYGLEGTIAQLVKKGADVFVHTLMYKNTPLHVAAESGNKKAVDVLIRAVCTQSLCCFLISFKN
jgi:ankyrin repeat protein